MSESCNRQCPECSKLGRDSTGDHLFLMEDGVTWACFKDCHEPYYERIEDGTVPDKVKAKTRAKVGISMANTVAEIRKLPHASDDSRHTSKEDATSLGIRYEYNETDGSIEKIYYPYTKGGKLCGYKVRSKYKEGDRAVVKGKAEAGLLKKFYTVGDMKGVDLFGQAILKGHSKLIITEGEEDIKAVRSMLNAKYPDMAIDYLSLPTGVSLGRDGVASLLDIIPHKAVFDKVKEVYLLMDEDEAGRAMLKSFSQFLGDKAKVVSLPEKDASDMLTSGKERAFFKAFFSAGEYKPDFVIATSDLVNEATERIPYGLSYPWETLDKAMYGARLGEITGIGAAPGAGKTAFISALTNHLMFKHKAKVAVFSLEEIPAYTLRKNIGTIMGKQIHLPDCEYDIEEAKEVAKLFTDNLFIYNHTGSYGDWGDIVSATRYYYSQGVRYFVIDPLSALVAHLTASEGNEYLNKAVISMSQLAQELGISWYHLNHLNNPSSDKDHTAGARIFSGQFSGSRAMIKFSNNIIALERDQSAEDEAERNTTTVRILKNRLSGDTSSFPLIYNKDTGNLAEPTINMGGLV